MGDISKFMGLTTAQAAQLSASAKEDSPLLDVPIADGLMYRDAVTVFGVVAPNGVNIATTNNTSWVDVVNYTGAGVIEYLAFACFDSTRTMDFELLIDGVSITSVSQTGHANGYGRLIVGTHAEQKYYTGSALSQWFPMISLGAVPFKTSLQIRHKVKTASGSTGNFETHYRYRKTA